RPFSSAGSTAGIDSASRPETWGSYKALSKNIAARFHSSNGVEQRFPIRHVDFETPRGSNGAGSTLSGTAVIHLVQLHPAHGPAEPVHLVRQVTWILGLIHHLLRRDHAAGVERPEVVVQQLHAELLARLN